MKKRSEEYPMSAHRFIGALREQRQMRLKGGLYHLNQIQMAFNTNRIEGSTLTEDQTRYLYETRTASGEALSVDDITETVNHFRAFDEMIDGFERPLTAETLKGYHRILTCQDGSGRVGRLVLFLQCMQNDIMPFIVLDAQKEFYYRGLKQYGTEPGFLHETFRSFQDSYVARFSKFIPAET